MVLPLTRAENHLVLPVAYTGSTRLVLLLPYQPPIDPGGGLGTSRYLPQSRHSMYSSF
jgi:hypothetical protein